MLEANPIPARDSRGLRQTLCAPGPRDPTETEPELCLSVSCRGTSWQWSDAGTGALSVGVAQALLVEVAKFTATKIYTGLGKQTLGGHKQNLVHTRTLEKGAVTSQETDPDFL